MSRDHLVIRFVLPADATPLDIQQAAKVAMRALYHPHEHPKLWTTGEPWRERWVTYRTAGGQLVVQDRSEHGD